MSTACPSESAVTGEDVNEGPLNWQITADDWFVYFPCSKQDLTWVNTNLKNLSKRFSAYDIDEGPKIMVVESQETQKIYGITINEEAFKKL